MWPDEGPDSHRKGPRQRAGVVTVRDRGKVRPTARRALVWLLALSALGFVAYVVPIRDRCDDPATGSATPRARVPVARDPGGRCTLRRPAGPEHLEPEACARLTCEPGLTTALGAARLGWLLPFAALYAAGTLLWAARWRALLGLAGVRVSVLAAWRITLESQAGGILLPGGLGGDALRVGFAAARSRAAPKGPLDPGPTPVAMVVGSVLLDRAVGLVTLALVAVALACVFGRGEGGLRAATLFLACLPVAFVVAIGALRFAHGRLVERGAFDADASGPARARGVVGRAARAGKPLLEYVGHPGAPGAIARAFLLSLLVSASQLAVVRGIVLALGVTPSAEGLVYVGTTMAFLVAVVPGLPGGWGTSDAAFVFFLTRAGLGPSSALAVSLVYRLFWYGSGGVGALLFLSRGARSSGIVPEAPRPDSS